MYCSPNFITLIDSTRMRRAKHVARLGRGEAYSGIFWEIRMKENTWDT
jgi:hypothetical protein